MRSALRFALVLCAAFVNALDNGLGSTPGMGWNSDYCTNCTRNGFQNEDFIHHIASYLHSSGLQKLGYHYVNMDASWDTAERNSSGSLVPDPELWPHGLSATVDYVHSLGLGFGLYGDRGTQDCAKNPGNLGHESQDAVFYATENIDWFKTDSCFASGDHATAFAEYGKMRDALNHTGRPIWLALCGWNPWYAPVGKSLGNSWRTGPDTGSGWGAVMQNVLNAIPVGKYAGRSEHGGGWNDLSLLLTPGMGSGADFITPDRHRSQFSLWCVLAANLLITGNLSALDPYVLETWSNAEAIAVNQDPGGGTPVLLASDVHAELADHPPARVAECGGEPDAQIWQLGSVYSGFLSNAHTKTCLNVDDCGSKVIYDGCVTTGGTCAGKGKFSNEQWTVANTSIVSALDGRCLDEAGDGTLSIAACDATSPAQKWTMTPAGQVTDASGRCLTAGAGPVANASLTIARPLSDGWAVLFLNNQNSAVEMECDSACIKAMGMEGGTVHVRDIWRHEAITDVAPGQGFNVTVPGAGASVFVKLTR